MSPRCVVLVAGEGIQSGWLALGAPGPGSRSPELTACHAAGPGSGSFSVKQAEAP